MPCAANLPSSTRGVVAVKRQALRAQGRAGRRTRHSMKCLRTTAAEASRRAVATSMSARRAALPAASASSHDHLHQTDRGGRASAELHKLLRDRTELFSRAVQPILWLVVFGQVFSRVRDIPTGGIGYLAFLTPGILAQSVLSAQSRTFAGARPDAGVTYNRSPAGFRKPSEAKARRANRARAASVLA